MRAPLLDHRVAAFGVAATRAFGEAKLAAQPKWLLREALYRRVPKALVDRPKMGFSVPLGPWLRTELREWADSLLCRASLDSVGVFREDAVRRVWDQHTSGAADRSRTLWPVLIFQQWVAAAQKRGATVRLNTGRELSAAGAQTL
jgi:asparagine synthase (glutamine-hydrolysing)